MKRWVLVALLILAPVSLGAQTQVITRGRASTANASTTPLGSSATFTGTWEDTRDYNLVTVSVFADQNSASSGWKLQWSSDGTNQDLEDTYTVTASAGQSVTSNTKARYFRVSYVNGGSAQATFRLATTFRQPGAPPASASGGGLTDAQLRATPVPVSGTVTVTDGAGALNVIVDSGTTVVTQGTGTNLHAVIDTGSTTAATQATAANLNAQVQGAGASGAAKVGNPVQQGSVFNTTQPTVTNGQSVEAQATARGAQIVATGVDAFTVAGTVTTTPPANASTNVAQVAGTTTDVNSGTKSAGTIRVVIATDQPALTNKLLVTPDSVALPANQSVNVAQMAGTATSMNTGVRDAGTQRVTVATNDLVPVSAASLPLPSGASTEATLLLLPVAQASTTSGEKGPLVQGAVTTAAPAYTTAQTSPLSLTTTGLLRTDGSGVTQPVSGTVTTTPPANASTNLTQIVGTAADVNSGTKSAGTLRVVLATDQPALTNKLLVTPDSVALPANQSVNVAQIAGTNTVTGGVAGIIAVGGNVANAVAATANPVPVGGIFTTTPATLTTGQTGTLQFTAAQNIKTDMTTVAGTATATGNGTAAGSIRVALPTDGTGTIASITTSVVPGTAATNLGKAEDAGHTAADVGVYVLGVRTDPTTTASTSANSDYGSIAVDHVGAIAQGVHPGRFSCFVPLTATITTQCQAAPAAGLRAYVTSLQCSNGAATVQGVDVVFGTGANCVTGITAISHKYQMGTNGLTTSPFVVSVFYGENTPLVPTAANAICTRPTAPTAYGCTITGFIAP